jgi:hypothetical protein
VRFATASGDKETRAKPVSGQAEAGDIKIVRGLWNDEFLRVLENFPGHLLQSIYAPPQLNEARAVVLNINLTILRTDPRTSFGCCLQSLSNGEMLQHARQRPLLRFTL